MSWLENSFCLNIFLASKILNCYSRFDFLLFCHSFSEVGNWPAKPSLPCKHLGSLQVHPGLCSRQTCLSSETNLMHTIDSNLLKIASDKVSQNICNQVWTLFELFCKTCCAWWTCWCRTTSGAAPWPGSPPRPPWPCPGSIAPLHKLDSQHGTPGQGIKLLDWVQKKTIWIYSYMIVSTAKRCS